MSLNVERFDMAHADEYRLFVHDNNTALVQQSWEWGRVIHDLGHDRPVFWLARDEKGCAVGALSAYIYACDPVSLLISVPQAGGYGGVIVGDDNLRDEIYAALIDALFKEAKMQGCALTTISTPPFYGNIDLYRRYFGADFERGNFYQYLDLSTDLMADLPSKQRGNIRRSLQKAERFGLKITFDDRDDYFNQWYDIQYRRLMGLKAQPLPRELLEAIRRYVCDNDMGFFSYAIEEDRVVGGGLFVGLNEVLDVYLMSTDMEGNHKQPGNLVISGAIDRARKMGFRYFNWQSCSSRESGVYKFKQSWGSREGIHYYLTRITGNISALQEMPLDEIKKRYRWHYVLPYEQLQTGQLKEA